MPTTYHDIRLPEADRRPIYVRVADALRAAIQTGAYPAGEALPGERRIAGHLKVTRDVVREAVAVLAGEGLVVKGGGRASTIVRPPQIRTTVTLPCEAVAIARMPSPQERARLGIEGGTATPVIEVRTVDGTVELYPAHSTAIRA